MNQLIPDYLCEKFYNMTTKEFVEWCLANGWQDELEACIYDLRGCVIEEQFELEK